MSLKRNLSLTIRKHEVQILMSVALKSEILPKEAISYLTEKIHIQFPPRGNSFLRGYSFQALNKHCWPCESSSLYYND